MFIELSDEKPISKAAFVAKNAVIAGDVTLCEESSVWFGAVLRGDVDFIKVGKYSNIQDNATLHCSKGFPVCIGDYVTVGHNAVVHGATIGNNTMVGMGSIIMDGAKIGQNCVVGAGALVTQNKVFPDNTLIIGSPAKAVGVIDEDAVQKLNLNAMEYVKAAKEYNV